MNESVSLLPPRAPLHLVENLSAQKVNKVKRKYALRETKTRVATIACLLLLPPLVGISVHAYIKYDPCYSSTNKSCQWNTWDTLLLTIGCVIMDLFIGAISFLFARPDMSMQHDSLAARERNCRLLLECNTAAQASAAHRAIRRGWLHQWPDDRNLNWLEEYGYCSLRTSEEVIELDRHYTEDFCPGKELTCDAAWQTLRSRLEAELPYTVTQRETESDLQAIV